MCVYFISTKKLSLIRVWGFSLSFSSFLFGDYKKWLIEMSEWVSGGILFYLLPKKKKRRRGEKWFWGEVKMRVCYSSSFNWLIFLKGFLSCCCCFEWKKTNKQTNITLLRFFFLFVKSWKIKWFERGGWCCSAEFVVFVLNRPQCYSRGSLFSLLNF